jgi:hypothetical protein
MENSEKIKRSSNMVSISQVILSDVWSDYAVKFKNEYRPFIRANETQQNWTDAVNAAYPEQIKAARVALFNSIPERFFKTRLYIELSKKLNNETQSRN